MRTAINIALLTAFVVAVPILGLFSSALVYMAVHFLFLGIRPVPLALGAAVAATAVMYVFFGLILGVEMRGALLV